MQRFSFKKKKNYYYYNNYQRTKDPKECYCDAIMIMQGSNKYHRANHGSLNMPVSIKAAAIFKKQEQKPN